MSNGATATELKNKHCDERQTGLYDFLLRVGELTTQVRELSDRADRTEQDVKALQEQTAQIRKDLVEAKKDIDNAHEGFAAQLARLEEVIDSITITLKSMASAPADLAAIKKSVELLNKSFEESQKQIKPILALADKVKTGLLVLLAAYFFKDSPELMKAVIGAVK